MILNGKLVFVIPNESDTYVASAEAFDQYTRALASNDWDGVYAINFNCLDIKNLPHSQPGRGGRNYVRYLDGLACTDLVTGGTNPTLHAINKARQRLGLVAISELSRPIDRSGEVITIDGVDYELTRISRS